MHTKNCHHHQQYTLQHSVVQCSVHISHSTLLYVYQGDMKYIHVYIHVVHKYMSQVDEKLFAKLDFQRRFLPIHFMYNYSYAHLIYPRQTPLNRATLGLAFKRGNYLI